MKTTPIPTLKKRQEEEQPIIIPAIDTLGGERVIKKQRYGYEYTLVEVTDRPDNIPVPCAMNEHGYALRSFRKIKLPGSII